MLPDTIKPINFGEMDREEWDKYRQRLSIPEEGAEKEFYRQVVYDHFEHFNYHYPLFDINNCSFSFIELSVNQMNENLMFFDNENDELKKMWDTQFDHFEEIKSSYIIYDHMSKYLKPPFPPVLIDTKGLEDNEWRIYGRPLHLIEGTHRTSYLFRMAEKGLIDWEDTFQFVLLSKVE